MLGPLEVEVAGRRLDLGSLVQRRVLAALLPHPDREVPLSRLVAAAWDGDPPATAARHHGDRAFDLYRRVDSRDGQAISLSTIGHHVISMGDPRQGLAYLRQALAMLEELGNKVVQISCWRSLGYAHRELGELEQSASCLRRGLDIAREPVSYTHLTLPTILRV